MAQESIFLPFLAMGLLTFIVLGMIPQRRFRAVFAGQVTPDDFALGESPAVPDHVALPNRNYMNLLEVPTLFYAACLALFVTGTVDSLGLGLAWTYVALRAVHSAIHVTYNKVIHRLTLFAVSNFVLMALWAVFAIRVWPATV
ncbi:MAG: MAPEG family protein [Caulobacterales bacterium]|nr:MAPEG family protein [Caulobacterales bacterium]